MWGMIVSTLMEFLPLKFICFLPPHIIVITYVTLWKAQILILPCIQKDKTETQGKKRAREPRLEKMHSH